MITNPSCQGSEGVKEEQGKFQGQTNPTFEEEVADMGGGPGQAPSGGTHTEVAGYSHAYAQGTHQGHYPPHYGHYGGGGGWQGYDGYYQGGQAYYPSHYQGSPYHQEWGSQPHMVLPPGPSPTGSNNSPSPHGFSDTNDEGAGHHVINRTELKRPSPDSFLSQQSSYGPSSNLHHQSVPKKPKVSKRRKKRDPNEPQKPVSAYALFFRDTQASIKMRNPNANFGEVSKIVAATWDGLDPDSKGAYKKRTEMAKKEYLRALAAYRANMVSKVGKCLKCHEFVGNILRSLYELWQPSTELLPWVLNRFPGSLRPVFYTVSIACVLLCYCVTRVLLCQSVVGCLESCAGCCLWEKMSC